MKPKPARSGTRCGISDFGVFEGSSGVEKPYFLWFNLRYVFVKINGERHYLWRAVDHEGEILESFVRKNEIRQRLWPFSRRL